MEGQRSRSHHQFVRVQTLSAPAAFSAVDPAEKKSRWLRHQGPYSQLGLRLNLDSGLQDFPLENHKKTALKLL